MEISVGKSGGSKTRSLDLETLYKSKESKEGGNVKKGKGGGGVENSEGVRKRKRKARKEVTLSSFEPPKKKKSRKSVDGVEAARNDLVSGADSARLPLMGLGQKFNDGRGLSIGLNLGVDGNSILIPKRPRGTVGRNKFANNHLPKLSGVPDSIEKDAKLRDEPKEVAENHISGKGEPLDCEPFPVKKIVETKSNSGGKHGTNMKQKGVVTVGRNKFANNHLPKLSGVPDSIEKDAELRDEPKEVAENNISGRGEPLDCEAFSVKKIVETKSNSGGKHGTNMKQKGVVSLKQIQKQKDIRENYVSGRVEPVDSKAASVEKIVKLNGNSGGKVRTKMKQKGAAGLKETQKQEGVAGLKETQKQKGVSGLKETQKQKEVVAVASSLHGKKEGSDSLVNNDLLKPNGSLGCRDQVAELKEILHNQVSDTAGPLKSKSSSADGTAKSNGKSRSKVRTSVKQKETDGLKGNRKQKDEVAVVVPSQHAKGGGGDEDPSSKRSHSNRRKRKILGSDNETVDKKVSTCDLDPDDDLEQNAARMLSSRFDPSCTGFASTDRTSALSSENGMSLLVHPTGNVGNDEHLAVSNPASVDAADRVLRPRKQQNGKGTSRKRRHFYEIYSDDMDAHWFLNRRIKIFWPLDESWYYGLVNDYDAEKNLHHIKYDDREEEWISLENERFKLLLLPSEVPHKRGLKDALEDTRMEVSNDDRESIGLQDDEAFMASHMESEPIISWLARSSLRMKSSPAVSLKRQKVSDLPPEPLSLSDKSADAYHNRDMVLMERETGNLNCSLDFLDTSADGRKNESSVLERTNSREGHLPIVYVRRRYRQDSDAARFLSLNNDARESWSGAFASLSPPHGYLSSAESMLKLDIVFAESKRFEICVSLRTIFTRVLGADTLWLFHRLLLFQYGTIVSVWPAVCLEVLFVDNIVGLRFFIFEGCLKQAIDFMLLVMTVFREPEKYVDPIDHQMPVTSIRFKLSLFQNLRKQKVFAYYSFSKLRDSNWLYLDSEFQPHCLLTRQLSLHECTYDNIKLLEGGKQRLQPSYGGRSTCLEVLHKKSNLGVMPKQSFCVPRSRPSTIFSLKHGSLPPFSLSFTAAPNFFLSLHLKLLMERRINSFSLEGQSAVQSTDSPGDTCQPNADACSHFEDQLEFPSECSAEGNSTMSASESTGSDVFHTSPQLGTNAEAAGIHIGMGKSSKHCLKGEVSETFIHPKDAETIPVEVGDSANCAGNVRQLQQIQIFKNDALPIISSARSSFNLKGMNVEIPLSDGVDRDSRKTPIAQSVPDMTWGTSDGIICSPNPTGPRSLWYRSRFSSSSSSFGDSLHAWSDGKADFIGSGFGNGPKKPRTQVQYTLPSGGLDLNLKNRSLNHSGLPYKRIRKANDKRTSDASRSLRRNLEMVACDANLLINGGDKGWRECGARVFLEVADQNEWKLAVKHSGETKYSCKVHQDLQPGSTNRYTHAMMWKGGKDWALEFPDRSQWILFKEMHEECHNRNIRAASIKNIPIPGVRLIEESDDDTEEMPFVRSPRYFRQVETDVEMAMDASRVLYDMDSDDEEWIIRNRPSWNMQGEGDMISDELFEKTMDMLEKVSYAQQRDHFTTEEIEELIGGLSPIKVATSIYEHWREKRQRKGMPLIRQLQPPLWERYQQICREWEQSKPKSTSASATSSLEKASSGDKPPMFAFCLKPRGLEPLNKGSKHRPHKKISLNGHSHAFLVDHDGHHSSGRRVNGYALADERAESSDVSPLLAKMYSPRDAAGPGHFSLNGVASDWNHQPKIQRNNSKIRTVGPPKVVVASSALRRGGKRNNGRRLNNAFPDMHNQPNSPYRHPGQHLLGGSDLDEFRLRDASSAAKHARNMAKLKRERAQKLMLSADLAIHKAVSALMTAEAIQACTEVSSTDGALKHGDDERMRSTRTQSGR